MDEQQDTAAPASGLSDSNAVVRSSGNIVETKVFEKAKVIAMFQRLSGKLAKSIESVERDPWPALRDASDEILRLRQLLESVRYSLSPLPKIEPPQIDPLNIDGELVKRNNSAIMLMRDAGF